MSGDIMDDADNVPMVLAIAYAAVSGAVGLAILLALLIHTSG